MKTYNRPEMTLIDVEDVIVTSGCNGDESGGGCNGNINTYGS